MSLKLPEVSVSGYACSSRRWNLFGVNPLFCPGALCLAEVEQLAFRKCSAEVVLRFFDSFFIAG